MAERDELLEEENKITLIDDEGNEKEFTVLLTFHSDDYDKDYVFYYDDSLEDEDGEFEVYVSSFNEQDKTIDPVTDEKELDMIEEVYNSMMDEEEEDDE